MVRYRALRSDDGMIQERVEASVPEIYLHQHTLLGFDGFQIQEKLLRL